MKIKYSILSLLAVAAITVAACEGNTPDDPNEEPIEKPENPENPENPEEPGQTGGALSMAEQKAKLESIANELISLADLDNWSNAAVSAIKLVGVFESSEFSDGAETALEEIGIGLSKETPVSDYDYIDYGPLGYWYRESSKQSSKYESTIDPCKLSGKFTLDDKNVWQYEKAPGFSFQANVDGAPMSVAGSVRDGQLVLFENNYNKSEQGWAEYKTHPAVYVKDKEAEGFEEHYDLRWNETSGQYEFHCYNPRTGQDLGWISQQEVDSGKFDITVPAGSQIYENDYKVYVNIPGSVNAIFKDGTTEFAGLDIGIDYSPAKAGEFNLESDRFTLNAEFTAAGYVLKSNRIKYDGDKADVTFSLGKGDMSIISGTVAESGATVDREVIDNSDSWRSEDGKEFSTYISKFVDYNYQIVPSDAELSFDVLGQLQVKGKAEVAKIMESMQKADESRSDETAFKKCVSDAEAAFSLDVYYDGSDIRSAHIGLEPELRNIDGSKEWSVVPVIRFDDGSSYAVFEVFFNENDFASVLSNANNLYMKVEEFFGQIFNGPQEDNNN